MSTVRLTLLRLLLLVPLLSACVPTASQRPIHTWPEQLQQATDIVQRTASDAQFTNIILTDRRSASGHFRTVQYEFTQPSNKYHCVTYMDNRINSLLPCGEQIIDMEAYTKAYSDMHLQQIIISPSDVFGIVLQNVGGYDVVLGQLEILTPLQQRQYNTTAPFCWSIKALTEVNDTTQSTRILIDPSTGAVLHQEIQ